jgi:hypothetical protein
LKTLAFIVYRAPYAAAAGGLITLFLTSSLFLASDAFDPDVLPEFYTSFEQLLGTLILLILVPAFMWVYLISGQRRSMRHGQELVYNQVAEHGPEIWLLPMKTRVPLVGAGFGFAYALAFNTPLHWLIDFADSDFQTQSIVIGQAVLWTSVGMVLSFRLHTAFAFNALGRSVRLDLLDLRAISPFAKNGVDDVLAIAILLAMSTLQSLDAQFRFENYASAMQLAAPGSAFLFILPMLSIHRRLVVLRKDYVTEMNRQIAAASRERSPAKIQQLESLMQHRDRIRDTSTWPLDFSIYSRLVFYIILPPIAWLGAAFVELGVDRILGLP